MLPKKLSSIGPAEIRNTRSAARCTSKEPIVPREATSVLPFAENLRGQSLENGEQEARGNQHDDEGDG